MSADVLETLDRALASANRSVDPLVEAITAKREQVEAGIVSGRMPLDQYQFQAGFRAGLSEALRIIEGGKRG